MKAALPLLLLFVLLAATATGCVTVRPQQRGVLSDPIMRFGGDDHDQIEKGHLRHALDNREGAFGAEGVAGGGCGCN
ncbi:MAG: DUF4266 domain-containing protein [Polyangiales bacterium]